MKGIIAIILIFIVGLILISYGDTQIYDSGYVSDEFCTQFLINMLGFILMIVAIIFFPTVTLDYQTKKDKKIEKLINKWLYAKNNPYTCVLKPNDIKYMALFKTIQEIDRTPKQKMEYLMKMGLTKQEAKVVLNVIELEC